MTLAAALAENDVGSIVLVEADRPVGIVTDRIIVLSLETQSDVSERTAADLPTEPLVTGTTI